MKATKKFSAINCASILLTAATLLLASCQKDEISAPGTKGTSTSAGTMSASGSRPDVMPPRIINNSTYVLVSIRHQSGLLGQTPDYTVSLSNNGLVEFQGRKGVTHIGSFKYKISAERLSRIQELLGSSFYSINESFTVLDNRPYVATTYKMANDIAPKMLIDNVKSFPLSLILLRLQVEELLNDAFYVTGRQDFNFSVKTKI